MVGICAVEYLTLSSWMLHLVRPHDLKETRKAVKIQSLQGTEAFARWPEQEGVRVQGCDKVKLCETKVQEV